MNRPIRILPKEIQKIIVPFTGRPEDAAMYRYSLYVADKLRASLLLLHATKTLPPGKPTDTSQEEINYPFQVLIQNCQDHGIAFERLWHNDSWQKAMDNVDPGHLTVLPFGRSFQLPDFKLEKYFSSASESVLFCPDYYIDIESIALAYDGSENAKRALELAVWMSDKATWPLTVLMAADNQVQGVRWMDEVESYLESLTINSTTIILSGPEDKALYRFMQEGSVELLIVGFFGNHVNQLTSISHTADYLIGQAAFPLVLVS